MNSKTSSLDEKQNSMNGSSKVNNSQLEEFFAENGSQLEIFFANELKEDTYWAENHIGKTLPKRQKAIFLKRYSQKNQSV